MQPVLGLTSNAQLWSVQFLVLFCPADRRPPIGLTGPRNFSGNRLTFSETAEMKCKYSFPVTARITLPCPLIFQRGNRTFSLELDNGRLSRLAVTVDDFPEAALPQVKKTPPVAITFPTDPELESLLPDVRTLEGALTIWGVQRIDTVRFKSEWIPENAEERAKLDLFGFERNREEEGRSYPAPAIDLLLRTIVSVEKFRGWEVPLNFNRRGRLAVIQERYTEAFYEFYFFIESLYGNGKFKTHAVTAEFNASIELNAAIQEAVADPDFELKSDPVLRAEFQKHYATEPHTEIVQRLVEMRGFLHHHSSKNKKAWNPGMQLGYKADTLFWQSVCHNAATKYLNGVLFDPVEMQKFKETVVKKPDGGIAHFTPPPDESQP